MTGDTEKIHQFQGSREAAQFGDGDRLDLQKGNPDLLSLDEARSLQAATEAKIAAIRADIEKSTTPPDSLEIVQISSRLVEYNRSEELKEAA